MELIYFESLLRISSAWLVMGVLFTGNGLLIMAILGRKSLCIDRLLRTFWVGFVSVITFLQVWHFFLPVDQLALGVLLLLSVVGVVLNREALLALSRVPRPAEQWLFVVSLSLVAWVTLATRSMAYPDNGDLGLYYLQVLRWNQAYPLVPGLGNLLPRSAFNNSSLLVGAMLAVGPWSDIIAHVSNGIYLIVLVASAIIGLSRILFSPHPIAFKDIFWTLSIPIPVYLATGPAYWLSPDLVLYVVGVALTYEFLLFITTSDDDNESDISTFSITILAATLVAIKLGGAFLAFATVILFSIILLLQHRTQLRANIAKLRNMLIAGLVPGLSWAIRGVFNSGYPAFPSTLVSFPVQWRVDPAEAELHMYLIRQWAYQGFGGQLVGFEWFGRFLQKYWVGRHYYANEIKLPVLIFIAGLTIYLVVLLWPEWRAAAFKKRHHWLLIIPPAFATILWFLTAPEARFAGASIWMIALLCISISIDAIDTKRILKTGLIFIYLVVVYLFIRIPPSGINTNLAGYLFWFFNIHSQLVFWGIFIVLAIGSGLIAFHSLRKRSTLFQAAFNIVVLVLACGLVRQMVVSGIADLQKDFERIPQPELQIHVMPSGQEVYIPIEGECWDGQFPCVMNWSTLSSVRMREPGNLRAGFYSVSTD